ncbi:MAG: hypothetical protein MJZ37_02700 [Bacilli bacterium]|nr:hypothetical protein [Bacilli bacterium]
MDVTFISFGLKHGIEKDIDMMVDCRSLPNPYYIDDLREKTGLHEDNVKFFNEHPETKVFLDKTVDYLTYHLEAMQKSGRPAYKIGVICTGGHHRSTYVANYLANYFKDSYNVTLFHRDCEELNK